MLVYRIVSVLTTQSGRVLRKNRIPVSVRRAWSDFKCITYSLSRDLCLQFVMRNRSVAICVIMLLYN